MLANLRHFQVQNFAQNATGSQDIGNRLRGMERLLGKLSAEDRARIDRNKGFEARTLDEMIREQTPEKIAGAVYGLMKTQFDSPYTTKVLPIRDTKNGQSFTWTHTKFIPEPLEQTDAFAPGRYLLSESNTRYARTFQSRGGIFIDSDFYATEDGLVLFMRQVAHLASMGALRLEIDALCSLLKCSYIYDSNAINRSNRQDLNCYYAHSIDMPLVDRMRIERDMCFVVNKTPESRGFQIAVTNIKHSMAKFNVVPDTLIVPELMINYYYANNKELNENCLAGSDAARLSATEINQDKAVRTMMFQNMQVIDTSVWRIDSDAPAANPTTMLTVPKSFGEFYPMALNMIYDIDAQNFHNYTANLRNIRIFNEEKDMFEEIKFTDAIKNCFRWDNYGSLHGGHHDGPVNDMFVRDAAIGRCTYFHHMKRQYLTENTINKVIKSMKVKWQTIRKFTADDEINLDQVIAAGDALSVGTVYALRTSFTRLANQLFPQNATRTQQQIVDSALYFAFYQAGHELLYSNVYGTTNGGPGTHRDEIDEVDNDGRELANMSQSMSLSAIESILFYIFMNAVIHRDNFLAMHRNNVVVPVDIILARPNMNYSMSTMIIMKGGETTGNTVLSPPFFEYSKQVEVHKLVGTFSFESASVIWNNRNVVVAPHVMCQGYLSGSNCRFVTSDGLREIQEFGGMPWDNTHHESLIALMVPVMENPQEHMFIDYRGRTHQHEMSEEVFHESADYYSELFNIIDDNLEPWADAPVDYRQCRQRQNSLCWLGSMQYGPGFQSEIKSRGHLGPAKDGVAATRRSTTLAPVKAN